MTRRRFDGASEPAPAPPTKQRPRQTLEEWAVDLCWVKACRDGFVSIELKGYSRLFACPQCDRAYTDRPGYTSIPSIARWKGRLELYNDDEMKRRQEDRRSVVERLRSREAPHPFLRTEDIERIGAAEEKTQGGEERETA